MGSRSLHSVQPVRFVVIHHTAGHATIDSINAHHCKDGHKKSSLGYCVAYNYVITETGDVIKTRTQSERGGHTMSQDINLSSIAVAVVGDFTKEKPTKEQIKSLRRIVNYLQAKYPEAQVIGHRDASSTQCPGKLLEYL